MKRLGYISIICFLLTPLTSYSLGFRLKPLLKYGEQTKAIKFKDNEMKELYSHLNNIIIKGAHLSKFNIKCMPEMIQLNAQAGEGKKIEYTFIEEHQSRTVASGPAKIGLKVRRELLSSNDVRHIKEFQLYRTNPDNYALNVELKGSKKLKAALKKCCQSEFSCFQYLESRQ